MTVEQNSHYKKIYPVRKAVLSLCDIMKSGTYQVVCHLGTDAICKKSQMYLISIFYILISRRSDVSLGMTTSKRGIGRNRCHWQTCYLISLSINCFIFEINLMRQKSNYFAKEPFTIHDTLGLFLKIYEAIVKKLWIFVVVWYLGWVWNGNVITALSSVFSKTAKYLQWIPFWEVIGQQEARYNRKILQPLV